MEKASSLGKPRKKRNSMVIQQAREVLQIEAQGILSLVDRIGEEFEKAVNLILAARGRVIFTGMGKSGLVARKISATLNSTGTASLFLHPAEAIHGDLGMVTPQDVVLAISNSGHTAEINRILPLLREMGAKLIVFTGNPDSPMAHHSDVVINVGVEREACPLGLAPTASTTAALAMGDALAVALLNRRRFNRDDFRRFHPGGSLGEHGSLKVREIMLTGERIPVVSPDATVGEALKEINAKNIGAALVLDTGARLQGILCDGDLRRALMNEGDILGLPVERIMSASPKTVDENQTIREALALMEFYSITLLVSVDEQGRVKGVVHLHDLLGKEELGNNGLPHAATGACGRSHHASS